MSATHRAQNGAGSSLPSPQQGWTASVTASKMAGATHRATGKTAVLVDIL